MCLTRSVLQSIIVSAYDTACYLLCFNGFVYSCCFLFISDPSVFLYVCQLPPRCIQCFLNKPLVVLELLTLFLSVPCQSVTAVGQTMVLDVILGFFEDTDICHKQIHK